MIELVRSYGTGPVMVEKIASRQSISRKYLENLLTSLKNAGLVTSVRGSKGGYALAIAPDKVTAYDVAVAVEGEITLVDCLGNPSFCPRKDLCPTRDLWEELSAQIRKTLESVTLQDMAGRYSEKLEGLSIMYHI